MEQEILDKQLFLDNFKLRTLATKGLEALIVLGLILLFGTICYSIYEDWCSDKINVEGAFARLFAFFILEGVLIYYAKKWHRFSIKTDTFYNKNRREIQLQSLDVFPVFGMGIIHLFFGITLAFPGQMQPNSLQDTFQYKLFTSLIIAIGLLHICYYIFTSQRTNKLIALLKED